MMIENSNLYRVFTAMEDGQIKPLFIYMDISVNAKTLEVCH